MDDKKKCNSFSSGTKFALYKIIANNFYNFAMNRFFKITVASIFFQTLAQAPANAISIGEDTFTSFTPITRTVNKNFLLFDLTYDSWKIKNRTGKRISSFKLETSNDIYVTNPNQTIFIVPKGSTIFKGGLADGADFDLFGDAFAQGTLSTKVNNVKLTITPRHGVPGPLPILGAAAAFGFSRKLRKRIQLNSSAA